jgi:hypothetical protein
LTLLNDAQNVVWSTTTPSPTNKAPYSLFLLNNRRIRITDSGGRVLWEPSETSMFEVKTGRFCNWGTNHRGRTLSNSDRVLDENDYLVNSNDFRLVVSRRNFLFLTIVVETYIF